MKLVVWNLNHRAARRRLPDWIADAIGGANPDVVVLTEYVEGVDHAAFLGALRHHGLACASVSARTPRQNQVLIATREWHAREPLAIPNIHPSLPSNALLVRLADGTRVLGFRMPAYEHAERRFKRPTWDWLLGEAEQLLPSPAILAGDFNTALGDSPAYCGDCLSTLLAAGWSHAAPTTGYSWQGRAGERRIDLAFLSPATATVAHYSWDFERLAIGIPDRQKRVGLPDHAMLVVETGPVGLGAPAT
jgi:endonuclease/exonuclease/phosphatase family metal-dependent hydrolase